MIFAYSNLSGYVSVRGSLAVHFPMVIAMLCFMNPWVFDEVKINGWINQKSAETLTQEKYDNRQWTRV